MSQPYAQPYPPQYPQAPAPQQYAPPAPPAQQYAPPPQAYYPPQAPQQPPAAPLATGTLDDYYSQPSAGSGPSLSWTDKQNQPRPIGTTYAGIVSRDVTNADIQQQTDFRTQAPKFYRDGRPMFAMKVPLRVNPDVDFPEGEASWYVKGQARDELVRAMAEAGCDGAPKAGATIQIQLVQRRATGAGMNPANIVRVTYTPPQGQHGSVPVIGYTEPQPTNPDGTLIATPQAAPVAATVAAPVQQTLPPQPPAGMDPATAALLAQLTQAPAQG